MASQQFRVLPAHVLLLRSAYVSWDDCEFGAPSIDCKRPYGNSDVYQDMAALLVQAGLLDLSGVELDSDSLASDDLPEALTLQLDKLHEGTRTALQVFLRTGAMDPGLYEAPPYTQAWKRIGD